MKKTKNNRLSVGIQLACEKIFVPKLKQFKVWIHTTIDSQNKKINYAEITVRIVEEQESAELNRNYRHKIGSTNVLAFPYHPPPQSPIDLLGDLVICAPLVSREAAAQHKPLEDHWAHLVVHGCLHLLGYDHIQDNDAEIMEALEIQILNNLGIRNPYLENTVT